MFYALRHPARTARWWRYCLAHAVTKRRRALATLRSEARARQASAAGSREAEHHAPDRGELIGQAFISRDGELKALPLPETRDDRFDRRPPLIPRDTEGRLRGW